jgi:hypothetical protein
VDLIGHAPRSLSSGKAPRLDHEVSSPPMVSSALLRLRYFGLNLNLSILVSYRVYKSNTKAEDLGVNIP